MKPNKMLVQPAIEPHITIDDENVVARENDALIRHHSELIFDQQGNFKKDDPGFGQEVARMFGPAHGKTFYLIGFEDIFDDYYHKMSCTDYQETIRWTQRFSLKVRDCFFNHAMEPTLPDWICRNLPFDFRLLENQRSALIQQLEQK